MNKQTQPNIPFWDGVTISFIAASEKEIHLTVNKKDQKIQLFLNTFDQELFGWGHVLGIAVSKIEKINDVRDFIDTISNSFVSNPFWGQAPATKKRELYRHQMEQISAFILYAIDILENIPPAEKENA